MTINVLFVCTLNRARRVVAERLYRRVAGLRVRSAGIDARAAHQLDEADLAWADQFIVFEPAHVRGITDTFAGDLPPIIDVGVPDDFVAQDPRLEATLRKALEPVLGQVGRGLAGADPSLSRQVHKRS